jgi:hypothetical protein
MSCHIYIAIIMKHVSRLHASVQDYYKETIWYSYANHSLKNNILVLIGDASIVLCLQTLTNDRKDLAKEARKYIHMV